MNTFELKNSKIQIIEVFDMSNFSFLKERPEYALFASAAIEAEKVFYSSPTMCAVGCRKALELAVKWVYSADDTMEMPYRDNLRSLLTEPTFRYSVDVHTYAKLNLIVELGNKAVHTERTIETNYVLASLRVLFEFIQWIDYCYGLYYEERSFDENLIPKEKVIIDSKRIKEQESLLDEKQAEIEALQKKIAEMSAQFTGLKEQNKQERNFESEDISEFKTRKIFIDVDLESIGWRLHGNNANVQEEYLVEDMEDTLGKKGYVDYVLFGKDGLPLAIIEAKRSSADPKKGRKQAILYADCLERKFHRRPMIFYTNGFDTYFLDELSNAERKVSAVFSQEDLQKLMNRRLERKDLIPIKPDDKITDRYYQKAAIRAVSQDIMNNDRKHLLVMATGTGKTRTASSLVDVLSRGGYVTNVLFLADRTALVKQAKDDFKNYLPDMSLCNLCSNKEDKNARIVFSTYPTILNAIDQVKTKDGMPLFTPAHFDLIIIDESHRSIFKKYRDIFDYFDAILVGLTATPKTDVDRNTYDFFEKESLIPTYAYDYETAVYQDHVLVPYYNYEVHTKFIEEGITYDDLSPEDKQRFEEDFAEDGYVPDFVPSQALNKFVFNEATVNVVLQDLMERGIKVAGGDRIGKTIIFAQNKQHAQFIVDCFYKLYPKYKGSSFVQRVVCDDAYVQSIIDDFKMPNKEPHIVVSVDMMDTGIDVPECVNLVFFKRVRSKTKFWQMIGRGTRLCDNVTFIDQIDGEYTGKRRFLIFDYCGNFEYFRENKNGYETKEVKSLSESIFSKRITLAYLLQDGLYVEDSYQNWRKELVKTCEQEIQQLSDDLVSVRLRKQYVTKYQKPDALNFINEVDKGELINFIAPIIQIDDNDEFAKRFDNFMYGMMIASIDQLPTLKRAKNQLVNVAMSLQKCISIPQVKAKLHVIQEVQTDAFLESNDILKMEWVRNELRSLMKFIGGGPGKRITTKLEDPILEEQEGIVLDPAYDFVDYKEKVNRYIMEHQESEAIHKLTHNIQMNANDYQELERIFTNELGSKEDYKREYGDTPFGLLIRKIAKMDREAANQAFSAFISDQSLNPQQIAFVNKVIHHIEQNGYMDSLSELTKPPFDRPYNFMRLFDKKTRTELMSIIGQVKNNAIDIMA